MLPFQFGETYVTDSCDEKCTCNAGGKVDCVNYGCSDGATCKLLLGKRDCIRKYSIYKVCTKQRCSLCKKNNVLTFKSNISDSIILNPGGHLYFRLDLILVKGLSKHTLNTYFSGMKIDPKYVFLHVFFLICPLCPFQNLSIRPKTHSFPLILNVFAPLNDVRAYIALSWKTLLITWFFFHEDDIQLQIQMAPRY